jgi:urea carboxylase-associated protein 2
MTDGAVPQPECVLLWEETIQPGATWSHVLKRGTALRLTDIDGGANAAAIFYNSEFPTERYNMPDTLKAQHISRLTARNVLYSDMGRILGSITEDSLGWHDPIGGVAGAALVASKYGQLTYQQARNDYHKNGLDSFLVELGKWGLGPRDLTANVNFFSKLLVAEDGGLSFVENHSAPGSHVTVRAEMNVLAIINTCQHPLDPNPLYAPKAVHVEILRVPAPGPDDPCRLSRPENERGFILTERYFL